LAVIAVYGPDAWSIVRGFWQSRASSIQLPEQPVEGRFWLGSLREDTKDEVVVSARRSAPIPYIEIHCHGGVEVVRLLLGLFERRGARRCDWPEFAGFTSENAYRGLIASLLPRARTVRTAGILLDQYQGALCRSVDELLACEKDPFRARKMLERLAQYASLGRHLTAPWRVVVAGAPNVGKSSLVNAVAGYQRCVVASTPGTTRDLVKVEIAIAGWPIELADTAGVRIADDPLEQAGVGLAAHAAEAADLCVWVLDGSRELVWPSRPPSRVQLVVNKIDLTPAWDFSLAEEAVRVSARRGIGIGPLCERIASRLVPETPPPGHAIPAAPALCTVVEKAWCACLDGRINDALSLLDNCRREFWG
jgi:tRNA modification GTPase